MSTLLQIINEVRANKQQTQIEAVSAATRLRDDLEFDSLDLAELTVRIERATGVDVFAEGLVFTVGEIEARINTAKSR